jgi:hypothetical protein
MKRVGIPETARSASVTIGTVDRALHDRKGYPREYPASNPGTIRHAFTIRSAALDITWGRRLLKSTVVTSHGLVTVGLCSH